MVVSDCAEMGSWVKHSEHNKKLLIWALSLFIMYLHADQKS